jgi:rhodanese-related sulfurtransferase
MASMSSADLLRRLGAEDMPSCILDVRTAREYDAGHLPGAVNIPFTEIGGRAGELPADRGQEIVVYCGHGPRAWLAARRLRGLGYRRLVYLRGHWAAWRKAGLPVET